MLTRELHATTIPLSRSGGRSAVAAAAYRSGERLENKRDGTTHDYSRRSGVLHSEIIAPPGAGQWAANRQDLWNEAEATNRKNAMTAREWRVGLPHELNDEQRKALAREIATYFVERYNVVADVAIHAPDARGDQRNFHAHILVTTREAKPEGLGTRSQFELSGSEAHRQGLPSQPKQISQAREFIASCQNRHLHKAGHDTFVEHLSFADRGIELEPEIHMGESATALERKGETSQRGEQASAIRERNIERVQHRPEIILRRLTEHSATFTHHDIAREVSRVTGQEDDFHGILARVENSDQLIKLSDAVRDPATGKQLQAERYSTREMASVEARLISDVRDMSDREGHGVSAASRSRVMKGYDYLSGEQQASVAHVTDAGDMKVLVGVAGSGKSTAMRAAKEIWEANGYTVKGAALSGIAAENLEQGSGIESRTLASWEMSVKAAEKNNGKFKSRPVMGMNDVFVIDEAGMVGARQLDRFVSCAKEAGAKIVLVGDHEQLQSIEAGAAFRVSAERVGYAEITSVRRQHEDWMQKATVDFAKGQAKDGLTAYHDRGYVKQAKTSDEAKTGLIADWEQDQRHDPNKSRIILTHMRKDARDLNERARAVMREHGKLGADQTVSTIVEKGDQVLCEDRKFAVGDRVIFLKNDRELAVKNGTLGQVTKLSKNGMSVKLDDGSNRDVSFETYRALDHGYASTIHKSQGATRDQAYFYMTKSLDRHMSYVAMSRHREKMTAWYSTKDFKDFDALASTASRARPQLSTLDFDSEEKGTMEQTSTTTNRGQSGKSQMTGEMRTALIEAYAGMQEQRQELSSASAYSADREAANQLRELNSKLDKMSDDILRDSDLKEMAASKGFERQVEEGAKRFQQEADQGQRQNIDRDADMER